MQGNQAKCVRDVSYSLDAMNYILNTGNRENEHMRELRTKTLDHARAIMMSAPEQILFFQFLFKSLNVKKVIEVGVFTGYGTLGMALGLPADGKIIACDVSDEYASIGKPFWEKAGVSSKIDLIIGPATETIENLLQKGEGGTFDFAYIDADKPNYHHYYEGALNLLRTGGIIALDNVLWSEKVLDESLTDVPTVALRELNAKIHKDKRVEISMLALGDGVTFVRKL
eukprot:TRINITY_DN9802_c0_g1_i1.p1 TRINITY_DN9802_c0_g1~~TRINITY_DN9802_c0_g1_i1.p1  ORF type:complete len:227 (+),score=33.67 TRINITY_DN9802_c0_g1_i1:72-752(+)